MGDIRPVLEVREAVPTIEGAGVLLKRAFGEANPRLDPFLLLDWFGSENPQDYLAGFPWHPHRGIETITYMLAGRVAHGDSLGNRGTIGPGEVQWMTAGSGIIHEEMPQRADRLQGFQLWANLPRAQKMTRPRYRDVSAPSIPTIQWADGVEARVICGEARGVNGPVQEIYIDPEYLEFRLQPGAQAEHEIPAGRNAFALVYQGKADFGQVGKPGIAGRLLIFGDGDRVRVSVGEQGARFLLISGNPLREPVAWGGPIVMNTREELQTAFEEYGNGTFLKP